MKLSRRTNTIILWITSIGLLVGMVITFTPTLGALGGGGSNDTSAPALLVNGETISELEVAQVRQSSPLFTIVQTGEVGADLDRLLVDTIVQQEVIQQEAARQRVGNGQVRDELAAFRERNGVAGSRNDEAYLRLIGGAGYTDQTFRDYLRRQLQIQAWEADVTEGVTVDDAEVEAFHRVNQDAYLSDPRVEARQIVVEDVELAQELRERVVAGESFAALASEASLERAEQGGALGGDEPQPVGRPAFPTPVADQVFARATPGLTPIIENAGRYYLVDVETIVPAAPLPLDEVRDEVQADALAAKRNAVLEERVNSLVDAAEVEQAEGSDLTVEDPVVAVVGSSEIHASDLARETYTNPQIQQALSPQTAELIASFFKPSILEQLIDRELAVQGAPTLDATFIGSDALVAQSALDWVARDAEATEEEIEAYYEANQDRYTVAASADVVRFDFASADAASTFRDAVLAGADPSEAAEASNGTEDDLGTVRQGDVEPALDTALFATDAFEERAEDDREVSDVLVLEEPVEPSDGGGNDAAPGEDAATDDDAVTDDDAATDDDTAAASEPQVEPSYVVLVAERTPQRVRSLDEVRADAEATVLTQERQQLQRDWLNELRSEIDVENRLSPEPTADEATPEGEDVSSEADGDGAGETEQEDTTE